jgi:dTDP-4-dehydrorhamnose reductase
MRIVVTGQAGQLGRALTRRSSPHTVLGFGRDKLDITAIDAVAHRIRESQPDVVINAAALTDVEECERDPDAAYRVNTLGARNVAVAAADIGVPVVQISSDYVFAGDSEAPYWEFDAVGPVNVYGASKAAAEDAVRQMSDQAFVVRSAWLFGLDGRSFVNRVLDVADSGQPIKMVDNEVGSPTFCDDLADALLALIQTRAFGTYHLVNEGQASRFELAVAILESAGRADVPIERATEFPRLAAAPKFAPLRNFAAAEIGIRLPPWREAVERYFERRALEFA